ncbi:winged helix-turn-helix transcriptional regulator [Streptomyces sp. NPDC001617]
MTTPRRIESVHWSGLPQPPESVLALTRAFALLGTPWNGLIITALAKGQADFTRVRERVPGISDHTLTDRLQELTTVGLITRNTHPGPPPRSQYALTPHGDAFLIPLAALTVWAHGHLPARDSQGRPPCPPPQETP